jgi:integrase
MVECNTITKWQLMEVRSIVTGAFERRFRKRRKPIYGSMNKGFTNEELERFFSVIDDPKFRLLFTYQATLGLRIGEAVRVNINDINLRTRELRISTEKARVVDYLIIPQFLFNATLEYIKGAKNKIDKAEGYLFYKEECKSRNPHHYLDSNYARNVFRIYVQKAGIDEIYASSDDSRNPVRRLDGKPRSLHRFTTHSLRHTAITRFARSVNGNLFQTCKFARHSKPDVTMGYVYQSKEELYKNIERAFS